MKYTLSEILSYVTGDDMYLVKSGNYVYVFSNYRMGDEDFAWGIYDYGKASLIESGHSYIDCLPDIYVDDFIHDTVYEAFDFDKDLQELLENSTINEWYKILEKNYKGDRDLDFIMELSRIMDGASEMKGETVTRQATKEEEDYIWKFLAKLEKDGEV